MAFVLVQHLAAEYESLLAEILSRSTTMPVAEVRGQPQLQSDHAYVIPPDRDIVIHDDTLALRQRALGTHHPIDMFYCALAELRGRRTIGVVLSGTATDGTLGVQAIKAAGGITFAQDSSSIHNDMPRSAIATGCVDFVMPPEQIALEISRLARAPYVAGEVAPAPPEEIGQILQLVGDGVGVDFAQYKGNTIRRRIHRRMTLQNIVPLAKYREYLKQHPQEVKALYEDILISVTNFFRNPEAFELLSACVEVRPHELDRILDDSPKGRAAPDESALARRHSTPRRAVPRPGATCSPPGVR